MLITLYLAGVFIKQPDTHAGKIYSSLVNGIIREAEDIWGLMDTVMRLGFAIKVHGI